MAIKTKIVKSSNIESLRYDDEEQTLDVTFMSGSTYRYYGIPKEVYQAVIDERFTNQKGEPSLGGSFIKIIRNNPTYKWEKLD